MSGIDIRDCRASVQQSSAGADLLAMSERIYPDSTILQAEWLRAVLVVRRTSRGWLLDRPTEARNARKTI